MTRTRMVIFLLIIIILITGCATKTIVVKKTNQSKSTIICGINQVNNSGFCFCKEGYFNCNNTCMSTGSCCGSNCTTKDANFSDKTNLTKINLCKNIVCPSNQVCIPNSGECGCVESFKWCEPQSLCIKSKTCCETFECFSGEYCSDTTFSSTICVQGNGKACKNFPLNSTLSLNINENIFNIHLVNVKGDLSSINTVVNGKTFIFEKDARYNIVEGIDIYAESITIHGGKCIGTRNRFY